MTPRGVTATVQALERSEAGRSGRPDTATRGFSPAAAASLLGTYTRSPLGILSLRPTQAPVSGAAPTADPARSGRWEQRGCRAHAFSGKVPFFSSRPVE